MQPHKIQRLFFGYVLPLFLGLSIAACGSSRQRANDAYGLAQQNIAAGNIVGAGFELRRAVQIRDDIPDIWLLLGQVEQRLGNLREAYLAFDRADELRPGDPDTLRALSYTGYVVGASRQAADAADRLLNLAPGDSNGLIIKGLLALDDGDTASALKEAEAILKPDATNETGILLKARAMTVAGDAKGAQDLIEETIARAPGEHGGLRALALQIHRVDGNVEGLRATFPALLKANPDNDDLYIDYANFLYKTGDTAAARRILTDGLLKEARNGSYIAWAFSVFDRYEPADKLPILDPRIAKAPASILRTTAARYLLERGDAIGAAALVAPQGIVDSGDRGIYAAAIDQLGKHAEAKAIVDDLLAKPDNQDADALVLRARWALAERNFDRAITDSQAAVVADPSNVGARLMLARAYNESGAVPRARQVLVTAANDLPKSHIIARALLDFLQKTGDKGALLGAIRAFADANPSDPGAWTMLANVCAEQGNTACVASARAQAQDALTNYDLPNPDRPNLQRGLFSPLKRKTKKA